MFHLVAVHGAACGAGVARDRPRALHRPRPRRRTRRRRCATRRRCRAASGSVLDPVAATRRVITLEPEQTALVDIVYGAADSRDACLALAHKYDGPAPRRPRVRARLDPQPGDPAPAQRQRGRCADSTRGSPTPSSTRSRRCAPRPPCCCATGAASRACGAMRSRATCRSCCCRSAMPPASSSCGRWCRRTPGGASRAWPSTWSSGTRSATSTASGCRSRSSA